MEIFSRTELMLGEENMKKLARARVAVFGLGGVGGYVAEGLARGGVGALDLIDGDKICLSNINRQILATFSSLGKLKVEAARERVRDINPDCKVSIYPVFFDSNCTEICDFSEFDYVVDAVDTVSAKVEIALRANLSSTPVISCMGAGNKLDPTAFEVADIYSTSVCPLARKMRSELKKRGVEKLKVVYSNEPPVYCGRTPASNSFTPPVAGLIIAGEVIKNLIK